MNLSIEKYYYQFDPVIINGLLSVDYLSMHNKAIEHYMRISLIDYLDQMLE